METATKCRNTVTVSHTGKRRRGDIVSCSSTRRCFSSENWQLRARKGIWRVLLSVALVFHSQHKYSSIKSAENTTQLNSDTYESVQNKDRLNDKEDRLPNAGDTYSNATKSHARECLVKKYRIVYSLIPTINGPKQIHTNTHCVALGTES
jgi:hypothetical protein